MSISDQMVVMDFGVVQQMAAPQDLYNYPTNLFVAKFLGNPPINVVEGEVKGGKVLVDGKQIGTKNVPDGKYDIGVRPEDFKIDPKGFVIKPEFTSHIGRDTMIGFTEGKYNLRALVDSDSVSGAKEIRFAIKPEKIHIFDKQTGSVVLGKEV